jgi:hypothetical protein
LKTILNKKWYGVSALVFVLAGILSIGAIAWAAVSVTHHGSVNVVSGGGGSPSQATTYTFAVYDAPTAGNIIADGDTSYFSLGNVGPTLQSSETVYIQNTGTGNITVTPAVSWSSSAVGTFSIEPVSVNLAPGTRNPVVITFTAGAEAGSGNFEVTYSESH